VEKEGVKSFGPWLRRIRESRGISASKMSRELDCAWSHYHAIEKGAYGAFRDYDRLRKIAELLDVRPIEVYSRAGALPPDLGDLLREEFGQWLEFRWTPLSAAEQAG
jgi:transcriptional regulator with XRE-family HTH domain